MSPAKSKKGLIYMIDSKCKICRRAGQKLFLKGEKCFTPKCTIVRKPYPPGKKGKRRVSPLSEYGKELREKQKLKNWYNLRERQFKKYVKGVLTKRGRVEDPAAILIKMLEGRLDNVLFRLGFANSRPQARQFIGHGHFLVNAKKVNIPSYQTKKGDKIQLLPSRAKRKIFQGLNLTLKKHKPPSWLELNPEKLEGKIIGEPSIQEISLPIEISTIFEFYSR